MTLAYIVTHTLTGLIAMGAFFAILRARKGTALHQKLGLGWEVCAWITILLTMAFVAGSFATGSYFSRPIRAQVFGVRSIFRFFWVAIGLCNARYALKGFRDPDTKPSLPFFSAGFAVAMACPLWTIFLLPPSFRPGLGHGLEVTLDAILFVLIQRKTWSWLATAENRTARKDAWKFHHVLNSLFAGGHMLRVFLEAGTYDVLFGRANTPGRQYWNQFVLVIFCAVLVFEYVRRTGRKPLRPAS